MLKYTSGMIPLDDMNPITEIAGIDYKVFSRYDEETQLLNNEFMLFLADSIVHGKEIDLPKEKQFFKFTRNGLPKTLSDGTNTVDGSFAHLIAVCVPEDKWDVSFFPDTLKKNTKSSSALTALLKNKTAVYRDVKNKTTVIFTLADKVETATVSACILPELCPWIASKPAADSPLMNSLVAIKDGKPTEYEKTVGQIIKIFMDWYNPQKIDRELTALAKEANNELINRYKEDLDSSYSRLHNYEREMKNILARIAEQSILYTSLKENNGDNNGVMALKDAFKRYNSLRYIALDGKEIKYAVYTPLVAYNIAAFETRYDNNRCLMHNMNHPIADFLKGVIKEGAFDIYTESRFRINIVGGCAVDDEVCDEDIYRSNQNAMPHPHLVHYHCIGGNRGEIDNYMIKGDYVSAVEQTISAASGVNIEEAPTFDEVFIRHLDRDWNNKRYMSRDGINFYTPKEAYNIMKEEGVI